MQIDHHEPTDIIRFLEHGHDLDVLPLNEAGWADYLWTGEQVDWWPGHSGFYQMERKTWIDLAGNIDEVEDLLRRQRERHPDAVQRLVIEGSIEPIPGGVMVYTRAHGKNIMTGRPFGNGKQHGLYQKIMGSVSAWYEFLEVYPSASYPATAALLSELYTRDNKPVGERQTFRRYFKALPNWSPNPQVMRLMGAALNDSNIAVGRADDIIRVYGTFWAFASADPKIAASKIKGVSEATVRQFQRNLGRLDV